MLDYHTHVSKGSMFNTPNTFGILVLDRVFAWIERNGGLEGAIERNRAKAALLYNELDRSDFWRPHAHGGSRSVMNVTWRLSDEDLEGAFLAEAVASGLGGLKGHRSVGGMRASIYNAVPEAAVPLRPHEFRLHRAPKNTYTSCRVIWGFKVAAHLDFFEEE